MKASFISGVVKYVSATIAALLLIAFLRTIPDFRSVFQLHFRSYALLSLLTIVSNCYLLFLMKQRKNREPETFWFALLLVSLTVWAVAEFFQRLSITPEGAIFWESFTLVGWVILPVTFFMFATTYTSNTQILDDFTLVPILIFAALFFLYAAARTDLIAIHNPALAIYRPWGYVTLNGPYFSIIIAWLETLFIMGLILLAQHYRQSHHQIKKRQTRLFIIGVLIPLVGGTITEAILPILGISTLPSSVLLTSIMAGILTYGIFRYGLFSFNPITIAPSILQTMNEAVLGVNAEFKIEFVNKGAMNMLGYAENDLLGMPLQQYISAVDPNNQIEQQLLQSTPIDSPIQKHEGTVLTASRKKIPIAISTTKNYG